MNSKSTHESRGIGYNLLLARISKQLTLSEVSTKLNIDLKTLSHYENGRPTPVIKLMSLCKLYDVSIEDVCNRYAKITIEFY